MDLEQKAIERIKTASEMSLEYVQTTTYLYIQRW